MKSARPDLTSSGVFPILANCSELSPCYRGTLPQELWLPPLPYSANWSDYSWHVTPFQSLELPPPNSHPVGASYSIPSLQRLNLYFQDDTFSLRMRSQRRQMTNFGDHGVKLPSPGDHIVQIRHSGMSLTVSGPTPNHNKNVRITVTFHRKSRSRQRCHCEKIED
jgi:hypothetical protein